MAKAPTETYAGAPLLDDLLALLVLLLEPQRIKAGSGELFVRVERELTERLPDLPDWLPVPQPARLRIEQALATAAELELVEQRGLGTRSPTLALADQGRHWLGLARERQLLRLVAPSHAALVEAREGRLVGPAAWGLSPVREHVDALLAAFVERAAEAISMEAFLDAEATVHNPLVRAAEAGDPPTDLSGKPLDDHQRAAVWRRALVTLADGFLLPFGGLLLAGLEDGFSIELSATGSYVLGATERLDLPPPHRAEVLVQPDFTVVFLAPSPELEVRLAPIAESTGSGEALGALFRLTRASVQAGAAVGLDPLAILEEVTGGSRAPIPGNVRHEVAAWGQGVRRLAWERPLVLRCPDAETAERLMMVAGKQLEQLGDRTLLLEDEKQLERVTKLAVEAGVVLDAPPSPEVPARKPRKRRWRGRRRKRG